MRAQDPEIYYIESVVWEKEWSPSDDDERLKLSDKELKDKPFLLARKHRVPVGDYKLKTKQLGTTRDNIEKVELRSDSLFGFNHAYMRNRLLPQKSLSFSLDRTKYRTSEKETNSLRFRYIWCTTYPSRSASEGENIRHLDKVFSINLESDIETELFKHKGQRMFVSSFPIWNFLALKKGHNSYQQTYEIMGFDLDEDILNYQVETCVYGSVCYIPTLLNREITQEELERIFELFFMHHCPRISQFRFDDSGLFSYSLSSDKTEIIKTTAYSKVSFRADTSGDRSGEESNVVLKAGDRMPIQYAYILALDSNDIAALNQIVFNHVNYDWMKTQGLLDDE